MLQNNQKHRNVLKEQWIDGPAAEKNPTIIDDVKICKKSRKNDYAYLDPLKHEYVKQWVVVQELERFGCLPAMHTNDNLSINSPAMNYVSSLVCNQESSVAPVETRDICLQIEESDIDACMNLPDDTKTMNNLQEVDQQNPASVVNRFLEDIAEVEEENGSSRNSRSSLFINDTTEQRRNEALACMPDLANFLDFFPNPLTPSFDHPLRILSKECMDTKSDSFTFSTDNLDNVSLPATDQLLEGELSTDEELERAMQASMTSVRSHEVLERLKTEQTIDSFPGYATLDDMSVLRDFDLNLDYMNQFVDHQALTKLEKCVSPMKVLSVQYDQVPVEVCKNPCEPKISKIDKLDVRIQSKHYTARTGTFPVKDSLGDDVKLPVTFSTFKPNSIDIPVKTDCKPVTTSLKKLSNGHVSAAKIPVKIRSPEHLVATNLKTPEIGLLMKDNEHLKPLKPQIHGLKPSRIMTLPETVSKLAKKCKLTSPGSTQSTPTKNSASSLINFLKSPTKSFCRTSNFSTPSKSLLKSPPTSISTGKNVVKNRNSLGYDSGHDSGIAMTSADSPDFATTSNATSKSPYAKLTRPRLKQRCSSSGHGSDNSSAVSSDLLFHRQASLNFRHVKEPIVSPKHDALASGWTSGYESGSFSKQSLKHQEEPKLSVNETPTRKIGHMEPREAWLSGNFY